jgi:iron complex outermembrane receptor protein
MPARILLIGLALGCAQPAAAQDRLALEEIIVTAQKQEEKIIDVPMAVAALGGAELEAVGVRTVADLRQLAPSFQLGIIGGDTIVALRGIGGEVNNIGGEPSTVLSLDGVPFARNQTFNAALFDVERIEVLRGPQGTINGRNSIGGAINIITNRPTRSLEGQVGIAAGNFSRFDTSGFLSGPLTEQLAGRLSFKTTDRDGYVENEILGTDQDDLEERMARLSLLYSPSDSWEVLLTVDGYTNEGHGPNYIGVGRSDPDVPALLEAQNYPYADLGDDIVVRQDFPKSFEQDVFGTALQVDWRLDDRFSVKSISAYRDFEINQMFDADGTEANASNIFWDFIGHQFSQELTLNVRQGKSFDWLVGALYLHDVAEAPFRAPYGPDIGLPLIGLAPVSNAKQTLDSWAVYGQLRWRFVPGWQLTLGGRYTDDRKRYEETSQLDVYDPTDPSKTLFVAIPPASTSGKESWSAWTPRAALDYQPSDSMTIYVSAARGFQAGGINTYAFPSFGGQLDFFDPETVWNYELGIKSRWLDNRLSLNLTGFHAEYEDLQLVFFPTPTPQVENAGEATIDGVEVELLARPIDNLTLGLNATWLDSAYGDTVLQNNAIVGMPAQSIEDNQLVRAPDFAFNASLEWSIPLQALGSLVLRGDYSWQDKTYFTPFNQDNISQPSYGQLNLRAGIDSDRWSVSVFWRNVDDERYFTNMQVLPIPDPTTFAPIVTGNIGEPETYGAALEYRF